VFGAAKS
jgi:hypothetical protein